MKTPILVEGYTIEEILQFPREQVEALVITGHPLVFRAGSAHILGEFTIQEETLVVALAQIEGGGEGVLPTVWVLCERFAREHHLKRMEWVVHAINCAKPNPKLRPFLERRGFQIEDVLGHGEAYHFVKTLDDDVKVESLISQVTEKEDIS